jgi:hypothetical protein
MPLLIVSFLLLVSTSSSALAADWAIRYHQGSSQASETSSSSAEGTQFFVGFLGIGNTQLHKENLSRSTNGAGEDLKAEINANEYLLRFGEDLLWHVGFVQPFGGSVTLNNGSSTLTGKDPTGQGFVVGVGGRLSFLELGVEYRNVQSRFELDVPSGVVFDNPLTVNTAVLSFGVGLIF